jgi:hypothetical protein
MPLTLIRTKDGQLLKFMTEEVHEEEKGKTGNMIPHVYAKVTITNKELKDLSNPTVYEVHVSQEEFHKDLRQQSSEQGKLITSHSTDPEWNPSGYVLNLETQEDNGSN